MGADLADKFSGADLTEICQTACKLAIREDIMHDAANAEEDDDMEDEEDFLPELLPRHFEEAVRTARRSVSDRDLAQYQSFARSLQPSRGALTGHHSLTNFTFPQQDETQGQEDMDEDLYT